MTTLAQIGRIIVFFACVIMFCQGLFIQDWRGLLLQALCMVLATWAVCSITLDQVKNR